jgi:hypothetical protein
MPTLYHRYILFITFLYFYFNTIQTKSTINPTPTINPSPTINPTTIKRLPSSLVPSSVPSSPPTTYFPTTILGSTHLHKLLKYFDDCIYIIFKTTLICVPLCFCLIVVYNEFNEFKIHVLYKWVYNSVCDFIKILPYLLGGIYLVYLFCRITNEYNIQF